MRPSKKYLSRTLPLMAMGISASCALEEAEGPEATADEALALSQGSATLKIDDGGPGAAACIIYANTPYRSSNWIEATGGRSGCSNTVQIHVRIRQDRSLSPDQTLAEQFVTAANHEAFLSFPCLGLGSTRKVFTETIVGSQKVQSARVTLPCD